MSLVEPSVKAKELHALQDLLNDDRKRVNAKHMSLVEPSAKAKELHALRDLVEGDRKRAEAKRQGSVARPSAAKAPPSTTGRRVSSFLQAAVRKISGVPDLQ